MQSVNCVLLDKHTLLTTEFIFGGNTHALKQHIFLLLFQFICQKKILDGFLCRNFHVELHFFMYVFMFHVSHLVLATIVVTSPCIEKSL